MRQEVANEIQNILSRVFMRGVSYGMALMMKSEGAFSDVTAEELSKMILTEAESSLE